MNKKHVNLVVAVATVILTLYFILDLVDIYRSCNGVVVRAAFTGSECASR